MADFAKDHPDAYAILKDTSGKEWKVRASKYFKFQTDQMHLDPANPFPTSTIEDSPYKEEEPQAVQQSAQTTAMPKSIPSVPSPLKKDGAEGTIPSVPDFKTFSEEHPMGMSVSSDAKVPFKAEEKLTTSYQDAIPAEELAMVKAEAALQAEYDKKAVQQIEDELADVNAKLAVMEKEYFNSADYLKYMAVSGAVRAVGSTLPGGTIGGALAFKDPFMFAPKELIDLQKKKTALMQAKEHKAVADEINKNNDYEGKSFRWGNIVTGAKQWGKETLRSFDPSYRSTELLFDKISIGNKVANGEELSAEEKDMLTVYALEDMMEQKYGSAKGDYGYIAGYGAPMMLEFMLQLAVSPGKGLAKASMTGAEKYAAKVTKNLIQKYGATAVRKNLLRAAAYTTKQTARLAGAGANSVIAANTSQAPALVEGVAERMAGKVIGERDEQGNVIGTSFIDRKSPARAIYEQEATMAIENFTEAMFEGLGVGKMVSGAMGKAGGKLAGTKLGQKLVSSKGASYMAELMENTSSTEWYKAFDKIRKAGHLGNAPEELLEEYAAIPLRHGMGVAETDMTMFEELTDPETFYSTAAGLSLGMGGMTMLQVAPASVSAGSDLIDYSRRKYFATSADKALHSADIGGASVFGEEWAYITPVIEAFTEEEIGNGMTQLINAQPTAEKKQAILNYMEALQEYRGANTMFEKMKQERVADDKKLAAIEARKEGYSTRNAQEIAAVKRRMEQMSSLYGQDLEDIISQYAEPSDFLRAIDGNVSEGTLAIATEYVNLKETYEGILDRMSDDTEARVQAMRNRVQARTNRQTGNIITAQIADEQGNVATDEMGNPLSFYVVDADLTISDGAVSMPSEGSAIVRGSEGKMQMLPASRIVNPIAQSKEAVGALMAEFEERIRAEEQMRNETELSGVDPVEVESETQEATSEEIAVQETPAPTRSAEQIAVELTKTESGQEVKELIDQYVRTDEDPEHVEQQIMAEYPEHAELAMEYYHSLTAPATEAPATAVPATETPATEVSASEAPAIHTPRVIRNKDNDLDVDAMIANGVTPEQMAEDLTAEFSNDDPGLALSTAQEYLAQVQEERAKTKSIIAKNGSLRKKEQFWSNVVGILTPQQESAPVAETEPATEAPRAEVPVEAQNANAKWQAAPKVYGRETTLRVKGMRLRGRYVVAPAGVATGSHTADFEDNADFIHDEQGRSRNPRDYSQASNQATTQEIASNFALQNMQIVSPDGIVYDGNGRQIAGDIAAQNGTDGAYLEDLMDRADEFGFTPEQIQGMEHPRVYFEVAPGQLDYSAQTFDKFNAPEMKAPSAVELGAAMGQVLSDETFNRLADTIKQSGGLAAVYKSKPLQEAIAYILRDASDVKDVTTATLPLYYNAETRTLTEAGRNLLEACLLGKIFADNPQVLALLPKLPNKVMSKVAQAMPELAANMQMGEYALKDELANALTLVYEANQSGTSVNDYATQQDWTKGGSATDIFGKTVVMLAKALNGEIEGAELADVVRAYNVKAVDVVTGQGSMFENPTREQMLQEVIDYYMKGEQPKQEKPTESKPQEKKVAAPKEEKKAEPNDKWEYSVHVDRVTGYTRLERAQIMPNGAPVTDAHWTKTAESPEEMLDILRNPLNHMEGILAQVETTLHNKISVRKMDKALGMNQPESKPKNEGQFNLVSDKRMEELKAQLRKKLGGQLNAGIDPEILSIGIQLAVGHIDRGIKKFADFAKIMVEDLGDAIRPYLKAFYNGARDMPEITENGLDKEMSPYEEVRAFDVANFDKPVPDDLETASQIANEKRIEKQVEEIEESGNKPVSLSGRTEVQAKVVEGIKQKMLAALEDGTKPFPSIVSVRNFAESLGMEVSKWGKTDILLQELVEDALVRAAREVVEMAKEGREAGHELPLKEIYGTIVNLYNLQPTISMRSSNRVAMQQYSTPLPMAFVADMFIGAGNPGSIMEPTAGNGMLVFALDADITHVNELDETRLSNLREQGYDKVTSQDATLPFEGTYDAVIMNPPFGNATAKDYDGYSISGLDPQIALNALGSMGDNGRAAIIIGGNMEYAENGSIKGKKAFFSYLYDHYNVKGVIDMSGDLYQKQGTTYPTRMILIEGRRSEGERKQSTVYPPVQSKALPKAETFEQLFEAVNDLINSNEKTNGHTVLRSSERPVSHVVDNASGRTDERGRSGEPTEGNAPVERVRGGLDGGPSVLVVQQERGDTRDSGSRPGERGVHESGSDVSDRRVWVGRSKSESTTEHSGVEGQTGTLVGRTEGVSRQREGHLDGTDNTPGVPANGRTVLLEEEKRSLDTDKLPYRPHNTAFSLESIAPAAMVEAMDDTLKQIEAEHGNVEQWVQAELGYETLDELHKALAAEQVDSVAMAIHQMQQGQALIIGDQTGVGKGRQMAALIRWAVRQGKKPIFVTQSANLFSDIYRDLVDIGSGELRPFIFNARSGENPGVIVDENGEIVHKALTPTEQKKVFESGKLPDDYDFAVLTYSQVNSGDKISAELANANAKASGNRAKKSKSVDSGKATPKATFLRAIAKDNYMFLDESHTAAGESNTGAYFQSLIKDAKAATFASATFAKRPDTMPLYALRTAMSKAKVEASKLIDVIRKGGVTLQELMSRALTSAGQMVRRERDMRDVKTDWKTVSGGDISERARAEYDKAIEAFNAIIDFQNNYVKPYLKAQSEELAQMMSSMGAKQGTENLGIDNVPFASKTYNYTKQLMLALKVDAIVEEVAAEIEAGRHPVIALESTMESSLDEYKVGSVVDNPSFGASLLKGLNSVMQYTIKTDKGGQTHGTIIPSELGAEGEAEYYRVKQFVNDSAKDIFVSPLDAITSKLNALGYRVGEMTGRKTFLEKDAEGNYILRDRSDRDKKRMTRDFNNGKLDVLILNKSASTGISLHASQKFSDQRQRTMIIAQPLSDINDYMQMIGRIDRTGQVHRGYYINLGLPIPAENRFLMMLSTKLKSLNANTTTSQDNESSNVDAPDLLNKYGDRVVIEYLRDNPDLYEKIGEPLGGKGSRVTADKLEDYQPQDDDARKITGRVALLSTKEQDAFYDEVIKRYNDLINYLNETNSNDLKITVLPLRAKTLSRSISSEGVDPTGANPFARNAYVEEVEMDILRKPMKAAEIEKTISQVNKGENPEDRVKSLIRVVETEAKEKENKEHERFEKAESKMEEALAKHDARIDAQKEMPEEAKIEAKASHREREEEKLAEKHFENLRKINYMRTSLVEKLRMFSVGQTYLVPDELESLTYTSLSSAIFCGYKAKDSKITASTTFAVFATLDGRRRVEIKLSSPNALVNISKATNENYDSARRTTLDNWDSQIPSGSRKRGYIMTGNILQAVAGSQSENGSFPGQLISYTDIKGDVHDGLLMPDNWSPTMLRSSGVPVSARAEQLRNGEDLISSDGKVYLSKRRDYIGRVRYVLEVPKSKKEGGKYYENSAILPFVEDNVFIQRAGKFVAFIEEENLDRVLNALSNLGVTVPSELKEVELEEEGPEETMFRLREDAPPTKTGIGYKVFVLKDGKLYPPMVANPEGAETPVGVWLDADAAPVVGQSKTGRNQVKAGGKGTQGGSGTLAYRPGWHLGEIPYALQFNRKDENGERTLFPANFVWAEVEYANDVDYQEEAMSHGINANGKFQHSLAGLPRLPKNGAYKYRTNPNPETDPWIITGAMKVNRLLTPTEVDNMVREAGREPQRRQEGAITDEQITALNEQFVDEYRQGDGRYTDEELALINDPAARLYGESFRTKKQQKQYAERVRNHMRKKANELAEKLHLPVEIIESEEGMAKLQGKKAKAKGWYEVKSGKIVLVLPNNESVADIVETVLHEGVAHLGLRKLFGKQFTQFLDNVYNHAEQSIREKIDEIARKNKVSTRTATEEYLASLAETTDFENTNATWWHQIKKFFLDMLHTIGFDYKGGTISDSELRYILWRSYENLKDGRYADVFSVAKDIALQNRLKAEEKQAKERRRILSLGKTDSNSLVADRVNEEGLAYNLKKGIRISPQEYAQVSAIIQTYPNKSERGHVFTANNYYLCTGIDEEGNFKVVAAMPIEGNEELINEIRGENKYIAFKPLSRTESTAGVISRLRRQGKRLGRNLSAVEGQAGADGRDDSVHLGQQANTGADQRPSDRNDGAGEEESLFRMGDANDPNETAQRIYNEEMLSAHFLAKETMVDYLASLESLQRIIAEKGGKITSFQDAYSRMLALSSRNKQEIDLFDYSVMPELTKAIGEILGRTGKINWESPEAKTLQRYTKVKHGIERDRDMAVRKALPAIADMKFKEQFAEIDQRIEESTLRSEYEALIKERADMRANPAKYGLLTAEQIEGSLEAEWYKRTEEIRAEEGTWREKQQKMDNAIAEVFSLDQAGLNTFGLELTEDYSGITETLVNEGLLTRKEVRKDRYAARKKAYEFVEQYEEQIGQDKADGLWNAIKAVSGFALEKQRQCGLVSAKYVADCNKRFEFYVPLRGFNEEVAHDVYDYLDDAYNNNNPVQTAKGRESEAGNPFANLMNIGYRSITAGNHNLAVQAFWNLANRKDVKGFLVPSRVWHLAELTPEQQDFVREELRGIADLSNDDILPYLPENASAEEIQDLLDNFEETMKRLKAMGYAYQGSRKAKQELRTLNKAEENAHRVKVYINGEVRYVTVVGNPRAAQALNGQLNPEQADWAALKGLQNFLAGAFTSQNPSFALANLVRDTQHANMRAFITENPKYWGTLTKKQAKLWRLGTIMKMLAAYENSIGNTGRHGWGGTLDPVDETHMRFKRFMEQGGATGFTFSRNQHENLEKLAKMAENVEGKGTPGQGFAIGEFFDAIRTFTEASELVNRFAAYETSLEMGRTEQQAIRDAKEITLNFNRKGAGRATYNASRASGNKAYTNAKYSAVNGLANLSQFGRDNLIFWNASVQGAYQLWSMLKKHPVKTFIAYGAVPYTLAAFGLPLLNALLCGGDDDKYYDELPEYERQRNICIKIPGTKGWFKIPLDPATQKIWAMGEATGAVMRGKKQFNLWNDIGANFVGLFSPVDIYWGDKNQNIVQKALSVGSSFTPTLAQPLLHTFANRDWKGKPLENDSRYLDHLPSYKKAFNSDKTSLTELSKWMNEWANEDADTYKVGPLDFASPGVMEELLFGYTGGYGQAALAAVETAWSLVSDEARGKFQLDKQPIINRFWVEGDPGQTKRSIFMNYNREVGDFMEEVEQRRSAINRDIKNAAIKQDDTDYGKAVDARTKFFNSTDWKKYVKLKATDAQVRQEAKGGIENASDITTSAMLEAIEMIHDDKAFEADEQ